MDTHFLGESEENSAARAEFGGRRDAEIEGMGIAKSRAPEEELLPFRRLVLCAGELPCR